MIKEQATTVIESSMFLKQWIADIDDAAEDIANQILNTFASDWSDTESKDSEDWKQTSDGFAVSPDNLMWYDGPDTGGIYGYSEPLMYRPARVEEVYLHEWKVVEKKGTLKGKVLFLGNPMSGAWVGVSENEFDHTNEQGRFTLENIAATKYEVVAQVVSQEKEALGTLLWTRQIVDVKEGSNAEITLNLAGPNPNFRRVEVRPTIWLLDDEFSFLAKGIQENPNGWLEKFKVFHLSPDHTADGKTWDFTVDDSVRAELDVKVALAAEHSVHVTFTGRLYASEDVEDGVDSELTRSFHVGAGESKEWDPPMTLYNDDDDCASFWLEVANKMEVT